MNSYMLEVFVFYTLCIIHLIILLELYSIRHYNSNSCIGYKMAYFRNTYAVDITKHDPSFVFSRVKSTGTYNNIAHNATIDNLMTLLHMRSDISYIEGFY